MGPFLLSSPWNLSSPIQCSTISPSHLPLPSSTLHGSCPKHNLQLEVEQCDWSRHGSWARVPLKYSRGNKTNVLVRSLSGVENVVTHWWWIFLPTIWDDLPDDDSPEAGECGDMETVWVLMKWSQRWGRGELKTIEIKFRIQHLVVSIQPAYG